MRINKYVAQATGMSRRSADEAIRRGLVTVNHLVTEAGYTVAVNDVVQLNGTKLAIQKTITIALNKPVGYVCSRDGQGNKTIYHLLPEELHHLKSVGRLDRDSSGLLLLTNDGQLAQQLTHPSFEKEKIYEVSLNKPLAISDQKKINSGIQLSDGLSTLKISGYGANWTIKMNEGRNRQIRRTFEALSYRVTRLHRTQFGNYKLGNLASSGFEEITL